MTLPTTEALEELLLARADLLENGVAHRYILAAATHLFLIELAIVAGGCREIQRDYVTNTVMKALKELPHHVN